METKVQGAIRHIFLTILTLTIAFSLQTAKAQDYKLFTKSIFKNLKYPSELSDNCVVTYTNLLLQVSNKGKITTIRLSDSAPELLKRALAAARSSFTLKEIEKLIHDKKLKSCGIVFPLAYLLNSDRCPHGFDTFNDMIKYYHYYDGEPYKGLTYNLEPMIITVYDNIN
ncbi:hypothetical protein ACFQ3S_08715 [Mucilaginibacter terrae]|uniref:hypothetical protein n=1 Tax=Mucilaginibacter terrae TaxID=1955052 RepID=UPI003631084A